MCAVGTRSGHARVRAATASFVAKPERQLQLSDCVRFEIQDGDREQGIVLLVAVIRKDAAHQVLGDLSESPRCRNRRWATAWRVASTADPMIDGTRRNAFPTCTSNSDWRQGRVGGSRVSLDARDPARHLLG